MARRLGGRTTDIVATDISGEVLERVRTGLYTQFEVQRGLPIKLMMKYFRQIDDSWEIDAGIRSIVKFDLLNLLDDFSGLGTFDIVFCRNVLIYFYEPTKRDVLARIARRMKPGGFLVLGAAETIMGLTSDFRMVPDRKGLCILGGGGTPASAPARAAAAAMPAGRPTASGSGIRRRLNLACA